MNKRDYLNLSTDMRRIAWWLQKGDKVLADEFIAINKGKFGKDEKVIEGRKLSEWIKRIAEYEKRGWKAAEDALTLSVILKNRFSPAGL